MDKNINTNKKNIFEIKPFVILFAILSALTWAFAFPFIKIGFSSFGIEATDTGAKTLFAGIRFFIAGLLTLVIAKLTKKSFKIGSKSNFGWLALFSVVNTSLHYFFFYIGLSNLPGSRSSIIDSLSTFFLIILACIIFKNEHMTAKKAVGCLLGFAGILIINISFGSSDNSAFTLSGDGMLFMSALCSAFGGILTRVVTKKIDPLVATGISLSFGGALLIIAGILMGGKLNKVTPIGIIILFLLVLVSAIGFSLYNQLISCNPVGEIAIFNSLIPIFGAILSCLILGETFYFKYIPASILVVSGVYIINKPNRKPV
ncbi:MAG: DMT family transporter [Acutalibacteraceae bacterium]|nr:DMT family transporter [Acutalibacteraceae bacterium]